MSTDPLGQDLSHFDDQGRARMVNVGAKSVTERIAKASGMVRMSAETLKRIREGTVSKGDVLQIARIAGIQAAKRTAELIPLCHSLPLHGVEIDFKFVSEDRLEILADVHVTARTGVEMEALTAVSVAGLTIYDMCKSIDREMSIEHVRLEEKHGGKSGSFLRHPDAE